MKQNDKRVIDRFIELALVDGESFNERMVADYLGAEFQKLGIKLYEDDTAGKIGGNCGNGRLHRTDKDTYGTTMRNNLNAFANIRGQK